jgi:hypothetical protein
VAKYVSDGQTGYEADTDNIVQAITGNGVVSGMAITAQSSPNMTVQSASGVINYGGVALVVGAVASLAIAAADATNVRTDLIHVTSAGAVQVITGTPAPPASVKPPALPATSILLAYVSVAAAATNIQNSNITDRRLNISTSFPVFTLGGQKVLTVFAAGNTGTALTLDWNNGDAQTCTATGNVVFTLNNPVLGRTYVVEITQDGTGSRTYTWPAAVKWPSGTAPTGSGIGKVDLITLYWNGTNYRATAVLNY